MKKLWIRSASLAVALALPACGDDATTPPTDTSVQDTSADTTTPDTTGEDVPVEDTAVEDTAVEDTTVEDTAVEDTAVEDTTVEDTTVEDTTVEDTTVEDTTVEDTTVEDTTVEDTTVETATLAELLAAFADSTNGFTTSPAKRVEGLVVTLIKPVVGTEAGGFFVQAAADGPAVFVEVDGDLPAEVVVGATLDLQVDQMVNGSGIIRVSAFSNLSQTATGADLSTFRTNLDDLATPDAYRALANRLISLTGDITNGGNAAGGGTDGYRRFAFVSTGLTTETAEVELRVPRAIVDATGLEAGCTFEVISGAVWGFRPNGEAAVLNAQPSVYSAEAFTALCDSPTLSGAAASDTTTVTLTFSRPLLASTVSAASFSIAPALDVTAVELAPNGRSATLTTAEQTPGTEYTVTVADTVTDVLGSAFESNGTSAAFTTPSNTAPKALFCFEDAAGTFQLTPTVESGFSNVVVKRVVGGTPADPGSVGGARNWELNSDPAVNLDPIECIAGDTTSANPSRAITGNGWSTATDAANADADTYYSVTFNAPAGVVSVSFDGYASSTGPKKLSVWTSGAPGFVGTALDIASGAWSAYPMYATTGGTTSSSDGLTFSIPDASTAPFELRFYPFGSSASTGTFRIDNLTLTWTAAQ